LKHNAEKLFVRIFLRSILVVSILLVTGVLSYKAAMVFWQKDSEKEETAFQYNADTQGISDEIAGGITKNLICGYDEESKEITRIVLEVFDAGNHKLSYVTIPVNTELTISSTLYKKLTLDDPKIPQVIKMSTIMKYLEPDKAFEDEVLIAQELLGIDINYYTAIPTNLYETMFHSKKINQSDGYDSVMMETFTKEFNESITNLDTKEKLSTYIKDIYPDLLTDLTLEDKMKFINYYTLLSINDISFDLIRGKNLNYAYEIDTVQASEQITALTGSGIN